MAGNTFGHILRVTTFGESHGPFIGAVVDGFPSQFQFPFEAIQAQLDRRRPGQSSITTQRNEQDKLQVISGLAKNGKTLGTPVTMLIQNKDARPSDYKQYNPINEDGSQRSAAWIPRPSHADATYAYKFGMKSESGGGRASARETAARVAAGALAGAWLEQFHNIDIVAWVSTVGSVSMPSAMPPGLTRQQIDESIVRCPDVTVANKMVDLIQQARAEGDSIGAIITCAIRNVPPGLGEPVFDKLPACLAHAMLSIPSVKGFDYGVGFASAAMKGSQVNDPFAAGPSPILHTSKNDAGGIQGGISNGETIYFRVAFKPPSTISLAQTTASVSTDDGSVTMATLKNEGRHDPCVAPRAVPIIESMAALVLMDALLLQLTHHPLNQNIFHDISDIVK